MQLARLMGAARLQFRVRLGLAFVAAVAVSFGAASIGCTGASESDLFSASDNASPNSTGGGTDTPPSDTSPTLPAPRGSSSTAPAPTKTNDPPPPPPGTKCKAEVEPNNNEGAATVFTTCIEGSVKGGDTDYVTIFAPDNIDEIVITHAENGGKVVYQVAIEDDIVEQFTDEVPEIEAVGGAKYTFRVRPAGGNNGTERKYSLDVKFK